MNLAYEAMRDAVICTGLLLAMPAAYCAVVAVKAGWKEVMARWLGKNC